MTNPSLHIRKQASGGSISTLAVSDWLDCLQPPPSLTQFSQLSESASPLFSPARPASITTPSWMWSSSSTMTMPETTACCPGKAPCTRCCCCCLLLCVRLLYIVFISRFPHWEFTCCVTNKEISYHILIHQKHLLYRLLQITDYYRLFLPCMICFTSSSDQRITIFFTLQVLKPRSSC